MVAGVATIVGTLVALGVWLAAPGAAAVPPTTPAAATVAPAPPPVRPTPEAPRPRGVRIASRDIAADMVPLGLNDDGTLEVPADPHMAGWWTGGARPGEAGPSVVVGHVDSFDGPGIFYRLADTAVGERVTIDRADGSPVHFRVTRIETHPKDAFPTAAVYGHTDLPTLRLVTCAGRFDTVERSYDDNVVVFAEAEAPVTPPPRTAKPADSVPAGAPAPARPGPDGRSPLVAVAGLLVVGTAAGATWQAGRPGGGS